MPMQLSCPICDFVESRAHRAWRLELCPNCQRQGRQVYLAEAPSRNPRLSLDSAGRPSVGSKSEP
jgi:hypothetical protein